MTQELEFEITHRYEGVEIEESTFDDLIAAASWRRTPRFIKRGRTSREILKEPAFVKTKPEQKLGFAKLKGVGAFDPESQERYRDKILDVFSDEPTPPTVKGLDTFVGYPHIGFNKEGEYAIVYGALAPIGGIVHQRAFLEYHNARILLEKGVRTIVPLAVLRYKNLEFKGQPMGVVITLSPEISPYRLSEIQYYSGVQPGKDPEADDYYERVMHSLGISEDIYSESVRLEGINILARKIGKSMSAFSTAGLYRYSSEWSNFEYDLIDKCPVFTDLDSTLEIKDLSEKMRTLQVIRDLATMTYRLVAKFGTPTALDAYTSENLLKFDPLFETLSGYLPNAPQEEIRHVSKTLWNTFIPYLFLLKKHKESINGDWSSERRRSYKMDHDLFYILSITSLFNMFSESDLAKQYPSTLTLEKLMEKAKNYLGERYDCFLYLLNLFKYSNNQTTFY